MKKVLIAALMMGAALSTHAQSEWFQNVKFSGYGMVQYQASDKDGAETNGFNLRLVRMALEGRAHTDFYWKTQMQINGNAFDTKADGKTKNNMTIRLVDLFGEWQKYEFFKVKAGQFKRPFTFENPMHPITQGFMSYSQNVSKLAGFADRTGEHASNGRDIGLQFQGDFLKNAEGRNLLHYQIGAFNGEGINTGDADNRKDIIGGMWVMPVKGMRIGAFGWTGSRAGVGEKNRYALSGEYTQDDWTFRTEYIHSQGWNAAHTSDKADGYYALCIAPIQKNKFHVKARYDLYREAKEWGQSKTLYEVGADYMFTKNLQINFEYARVNERTIADPDKHNYNMVDVELDFRF
ncbi:OprO/OprP family phosphate-selective porin [Prevotella sp. E15-22]|uniref:porin n=1 Tax=Prevotella sp. E15-22 TaxID=2937774 RepID=UPI00204B7BEB|nr:porin [Prevotella sp. E15-22]UPS43683.1 OprO/OprP family phosphate-selective porin [Prevotella sp. E15-22]